MTSDDRRLKETGGPVHLLPAPGGAYSTLCAIDGEEHELRPTEEAPTCRDCLGIVRTVLEAAPVRTLRAWLAASAAPPSAAPPPFRRWRAALLGLALLGACRVTPEPCCRRPCTTDAQCNPSLWEVCAPSGCCTCTPPDGGTCPAAVAEPEPAAALPGIDAGCP